MNPDNKETFDTGKFVISLDFELYWGVRDKRKIEDYGNHILGVREAIPAMIRLFDKYEVKVTFSTVGFLFAKDRDTLKNFIPKELPAYNQPVFSPYPALNAIGNNEKDDPYHFGYSLLKLIEANKNHEIGTHTFSHYYCLEPGQTIESFRQDIAAARKIAAAENIVVRSLVFPRNQFNETYLTVCKEQGIDSFRGNPVSWLYEPRNKNEESVIRRIVRFIDAYINITGHHCHSRKYIASFPITNVAASRFLRPINPRLTFIESLRLRRITKAMQAAARSKKLFHLWWHPHNFGVNLAANLLFLEKILMEFKRLERNYKFQSKTMSGITDELSNR